MSLQDIILNYVIALICNNIGTMVSLATCLLAVWRVSRLRGITLDNYEDMIKDSVADTLKEQISLLFLGPFFQQQGVQLPRGRTPADLLELYLERVGDPQIWDLLSNIYHTLETMGVDSPHYQQILSSFFGLG